MDLHVNIITEANRNSDFLIPPYLLPTLNCVFKQCVCACVCASACVCVRACVSVKEVKVTASVVAVVDVAQTTC